ncbi:hypothetical protein [Pontibacter roseus]|nr:hypothetical protein [Pontibacter roseus]
METIVIVSVLALYAVGYMLYYMYAKDDSSRKRRRKFYDQIRP